MTLPIKYLARKRDTRVVFGRVVFGRFVVAKRPLILWELKCADGSQHNAEDRNVEAVRRDSLLIKEMEEINKWARLGSHLYFGWFTLILAVNSLAIGWLLTNAVARTSFTRLIFFIFTGLDLIGAIVTFYIRKHMLKSDLRIKEVLEALTQRHVTEDAYAEPQSPMPRQAINIAFAFTGGSLLTLMIFWVIWVIWL